jgi:phosphatidylglycerophosphatase A
LTQVYLNFIGIKLQQQLVRNFFYHLIATALGTGYAPLAPGTAGSLLALFLIYYFYPPSWILLLSILLLFLLGVYCSGKLEIIHGEDPSLVVVDEVVGMAISLLFLPRNWLLFLLAFLLFRFFDIVKPAPINSSQKLRAGWGIMIDDVLAGIYAIISVQILRFLYVLVIGHQF